MPNRPHLTEVTVDAKTTAMLVVDLNARCEEPEQPCHRLAEPVEKFLNEEVGSAPTVR
jgi:hypothetical protein